KVMASGGFNTPGTAVDEPQFSLADLRLIVDRAHAAGLAGTAHAHALAAVEQALAVGVDGIEHFSCLTSEGFGGTDELLDRVAAAGVTVATTFGFDPDRAGPPPPLMLAKMAEFGWTWDDVVRLRAAWLRRVCGFGVRLVCG